MGLPIYLTLTEAGSTPAQLANYHAQPFNLTISVTVTGSVTYTVQVTYDNTQNLPNPTSYSPTVPNPTWVDDPILASSTSSGVTTYNDPIQAWRVTYVSGSGSLSIVGIQAGIRG